MLITTACRTKAGTCPTANTGGKKRASCPPHAHFPHAHRDTMAALPRLLLSLLLAASFCLLVFGGSPVPRRTVTKTLDISNGLNMGDWGDPEYCEDGTFAAYIEAKFQDYSSQDVDETALNALLLYCVNKDTGITTGHISSTVGEKGEWQGMRSCPNGFISAVRARVLENQGAFADNVAIQNFQFECNRSTTLITAVDGMREWEREEMDLGVWSDWSACPEDSAICGLEMRYEPVSLLTDDAATSNALFYCCAV